jgi:C4-dicarboxylate-specific signal transduction histidine kinase
MATMSAARRRAEHSLEKAREELGARVRDRTADLERTANLPHGGIFQFTLTMDLGVAAGVQMARISGAVP